MSETRHPGPNRGHAAVSQLDPTTGTFATEQDAVDAYVADQYVRMGFRPHEAEALAVARTKHGDVMSHRPDWQQIRRMVVEQGCPLGTVLRIYGVTDVKEPDPAELVTDAAAS